ncbi:MAG: hypothetical protein ACI8QC_000278 [Planctomycetota bacterium]|jgi:hypothetical protein
MTRTINLAFALLALAPSTLAIQPIDDAKQKGAYAKEDGSKKKAGYEKKALTESDRAELASLLNAVLADVKSGKAYSCAATCTEEDGCSDECEAGQAPANTLSKSLRGNVAAMEVVAPLAAKALRTAATTDAQVEAVVKTLLNSNCPTLGKVGDSLCAAAPKRMSATHLLAFTEIGSETTRDLLAKAVKKGKGGINAAAYFAFKGEKIGKKTLLAAAKTKNLTAENTLEVLLAGYALESLGDSKARMSVQIRVHDAALALLDAGDLEHARSMALTADRMRRIMRNETRFLSRLTSSDGDGDGDGDGKKKKKLASADAVFELLERVTPLL